MSSDKLRSRLIDLQFVDFHADLGRTEPDDLFFDEKTIEKLANHQENLKRKFNKSIGLMVFIDIFIILLIHNPFFELALFSHEIKNTPGLLITITILSTGLYIGSVYHFLNMQSYDNMIFNILLKKYNGSQIDKIKSVYIENDFTHSILTTELKYSNINYIKRISSILTITLVMATSLIFFIVHFASAYYGANYVLSDETLPIIISATIVGFVILGNLTGIIYFYVGFVAKFETTFASQ